MASDQDSAPVQPAISEKFTQGAYHNENEMVMLLEKHASKFAIMHKKFAGREDDDYNLYRFMKAFNFDIDICCKKLEETIKWREANDFDRLKEAVKDLDPNDMDEFPNGKLIAKYFPQCPKYSEDRDGNIVGIICPGRSFPEEIIAHVSKSDLELFGRYAMTTMSLNVLQLSHKRGSVVRMTRIIDMKGLGLRHTSRAMLDIVKGILSVAQAHFVEHMSKIFIINAPIIFNVVWAVINPILSERTRKKVINCGSNYTNTLLKYIDPEQLPICYGGTCSREPIHSHDPDAGFDKIIVAAGGCVEKSVSVGAGCVVEWSIRSESHDIGLSVDFSNDSELLQVQAPARIPSNSHTVIGSWSAPSDTSGTALFKFDNRYSRFTSKHVKVRIDTLPPL